MSTSAAFPFPAPFLASPSLLSSLSMTCTESSKSELSSHWGAPAERALAALSTTPGACAEALASPASPSTGAGVKTLGSVSRATRLVTGETSASKCGLKPSTNSSTPTVTSRIFLAWSAVSSCCTGTSCCPGTVGASDGRAMHEDAKAAVTQSVDATKNRREAA